MNIDFTHEPLFSWYVVLLVFSGIVTLATVAVKPQAQKLGWRILSIVVGAGFIGYGIYLGFVFKGGHYIIFFKAFIVPIVLVVNAVRSITAKRRVAAAA
ncbi:hypothetical protein [Phaeacidiphilus oryzae]|uniref:hypothetical protein n=1 Tax=Phaeacidiphilus oryzae TaxID=348818 RepID=UPI001269FE79|nr:hypothetical protein [Phaeacidiphilus oryzae]